MRGNISIIFIIHAIMSLAITFMALEKLWCLLCSTPKCLDDLFSYDPETVRRANDYNY